MLSVEPVLGLLSSLTIDLLEDYRPESRGIASKQALSDAASPLDLTCAPKLLAAPLLKENQSAQLSGIKNQTESLNSRQRQAQTPPKMTC